MIIVVGNIEFDGRIDGWWIMPVNCWVVNVVVSLVKVARKKRRWERGLNIQRENYSVVACQLKNLFEQLWLFEMNSRLRKEIFIDNGRSCMLNVRKEQSPLTG